MFRAVGSPLRVGNGPSEGLVHTAYLVVFASMGCTLPLAGHWYRETGTSPARMSWSWPVSRRPPREWNLHQARHRCSARRSRYRPPRPPELAPGTPHLVGIERRACGPLQALSAHHC